MASKVVEGICALCRKPKRLRQSHILPKFIWRNSGVIGHGNRYDLISMGDQSTTKLNQQDGPKEFLCCGTCEGLMSRWEDMGRRVWFNENSPFRHPEPKEGGYVIQSVPYSSMKLFLMSVIWRMGVSENPYFVAVSLGTHEHRLRRMLLAEDPGEPWRYGCLVSVLKHRGALVGDYFSQPAEWDLKSPKGHKLFGLVAAGICFVFVVGAKTLIDPFDERFLKPGEPWFLKTREISRYASLWGEFQMWAKANGHGI